MDLEKYVVERREEVVDGLRRWLMLYLEWRSGNGGLPHYYCPFAGLGRGCELCKAVFGIKRFCPCLELGIDEVARRAWRWWLVLTGR